MIELDVDRDTQMSWGVKETFSTYVVGSGGSITIGGPASDLGGSYVFPYVGTSTVDGFRVLQFGGSVRFRAHSGAMDVMVDSPWIHIGPDTAQLSIAGTEQTRNAGGRLRLADLRVRERLDNGALFDVLLILEGGAAFDYRYPVGTDMDPIALSSAGPNLSGDRQCGRH